MRRRRSFLDRFDVRMIVDRLDQVAAQRPQAPGDVLRRVGCLVLAGWIYYGIALAARGDPGHLGIGVVVLWTVVWLGELALII